MRFMSIKVNNLRSGDPVQTRSGVKVIESVNESNDSAVITYHDGTVSKMNFESRVDIVMAD